MKPLCKNRLASLNPSGLPLEERTLLAGNITFTFPDGTAKSVKQAAKKARAFWENVITTNKKINMWVQVRELDGRDGRFGQQFFGQYPDNTPVLIEVDKADLENPNGRLRKASVQFDLMVHEMGHGLGLLEHEKKTVMNSVISNSLTISKKQLALLKKNGWIKKK
jgi:hypothetical protein